MNAAEKARIAREQAEKEAINLKNQEAERKRQEELEKKRQEELKRQQEEERKRQEEQNKQEEFVNKKVEEIAKTKVGKIVTFGKYPQKNQNDPIEWIVIENVCGEIKLLSKYILDCHEFIGVAERSEFSYEFATIRNFLNEDFFNKAFTKNEQKKIKVCQLDSKIEKKGFVEYCSSTDKVYLLSEFEIHKMKKKFLKTKLTEHAKSKSDLPRWWIRDVYDDWNKVAPEGQFYFKGKKYRVFLDPSCVNKFTYRGKGLSTRQDLKHYGVRPVITLKLDD